MPKFYDAQDENNLHGDLRFNAVTQSGDTGIYSRKYNPSTGGFDVAPVTETVPHLNNAAIGGDAFANAPATDQATLGSA
jgi:hypothetical protein